MPCDLDSEAPRCRVEGKESKSAAFCNTAAADGEAWHILALCPAPSSRPCPMSSKTFTFSCHRISARCVVCLGLAGPEGFVGWCVLHGRLRLLPPPPAAGLDRRIQCSLCPFAHSWRETAWEPGAPPQGRSSPGRTSLSAQWLPVAQSPTTKP